MENIEQEKRRFNRVPFSYSDNILGTFIHPSDQDKIYAHILNFSIQGLYFTLKKAEKDIKEGDKLVLLEIRGPKNQDYIVNIDMEIKRVLDYPSLQHFGYGCHFTSFPDSSRKQIRRFLEMWFLEGRDY